MATPRPREIEQAVERGLDFIYHFACKRRNLCDYGSDLLWCFYLISSTSKNPALRAQARRMGNERARQWRKDYPSLPSDRNADVLVDYLYGSSAAHKLGYTDARLDAEIMNAIGEFPAADYLCFDPTKEPPPADVSERCVCGVVNERGRKRCSKCRKGLTTLNRYEVGFYALTRTYSADRYGLSLGARYADVIRWLPQMRPYCDSDDPEFYDTVYFVTHVIYTLNAYGRYRLSPRWLPQEFDFLKTHLRTAISSDDPEMTGEFVDSLKAFGLKHTHPLIRRGITYLLSKQNDDGSWGDLKFRDGYARYHSTWTAVDGLRDYAWHGERICFPKLLPALKRCARRNGRP
jgi:hypothetical protein